MYYSANRIKGFALHALDGVLGKVVDFCFDDASWYVRYLVVDVGSLLRPRRVLVASSLVGHLDIERRQVGIFLSREHLLHSPDLGSDLTVNKRHEDALLAHYGWPAYWDGFSSDEVYGAGNPWLPHPDDVGAAVPEGDPHLRGLGEIEGFRLMGSDGEVGTVEDLVLDDAVWNVRYLVTHTRAWLAGRRVLVSPEWVAAIAWEDSEVLVDRTGEEVRNSLELVEDGQ